MDARYNEYIAFLEKYRDELAAYLLNEREKRQALLDNHLDRLEAMLKIQQAETMKLRAMESKRAKLQSDLNLPNVKAKELLAMINDPEAGKHIETLFKEIADISGEIREQNRQSLELAKINLKVSDLFLRGGEAEMPIKFYGPDSGQHKVYSSGDALEETI